MWLRRLVAYPESRRILHYYLWATPFLALQSGVLAMVPVLLRKHFEANVWQIAAATSAIAVMSILAIFWNELYCRTKPSVYLIIFWLFSVLPLGAIALCRRPGPVLVFVLISAAGMGGIKPISGDFLRSCFPPATRSRVWSILTVAEQLTVMVSAFLIGVWLDFDPMAYRIYFPVSAVFIAVGLLILLRITHQSLFQERMRACPTESLISSLRYAYRSMGRVLREDADFRRYETAFCIYGIGWMICHALLPFILVDVLGLKYGQAAWSTQVAFQLTVMMAMIPVGYLMDLHGPVRISAWSFSFLILYPLALMYVNGAFSLMGASILYAVGMSGINLAWTLGPVMLAPNASRAPHYLAIHATLVAVRAILGQFPAVGIYWYTRSYRIPLCVAIVMFVIGAVLMVRLERDRRRLVPDLLPVPVPVPAAVSVQPEQSDAV